MRSLRLLVQPQEVAEVANSNVRKIIGENSVFFFNFLARARTASDMDRTFLTDLAEFEKIRDIKKVL